MNLSGMPKRVARSAGLVACALPPYHCGSLARKGWRPSPGMSYSSASASLTWCAGITPAWLHARSVSPAPMLVGVPCNFPDHRLHARSYLLSMGSLLTMGRVPERACGPAEDLSSRTLGPCVPRGFALTPALSYSPPLLALT